MTLKRSPLNQMSPKRRQQFLDAGLSLGSTFLPPQLRRPPRTVRGTSGGDGSAGEVGSSKPPARTKTWLPRPVGLTRGSRPTGPDRLTVEAVLERDQWSCAYCGGEIYGDRGTDWSIGHRRPRGSGGDPRPETNRTANLVTLHGSGTTGCHGEIESERDHAEALGFLIPWTANPCAEPIRHALYDWCRLTDRGEAIQIKNYDKAGT